MTMQVTVPAQTLPVIGQADVCVIGGSCTGVFAAIRAARLGARVIIVEKQNRFGGVAVSGLVNIWHDIFDTEGKNQIIAGLTQETLSRLERRKEVDITPHLVWKYAIFNSEELAIELDEMVAEAGIVPMFHTVFSEPYYQDGKLAGVIVDNKSGRGVILAQAFVDASGDGDLCVRAGFSSWRAPVTQPPTTCARFSGWSLPQGFDYASEVFRHAAEYKLPPGFIWGEPVPNSDLFMMAGTRVPNCDCADAAQLTAAEIEGRRQLRAIKDILKKYCGMDKLEFQALSSMIGIRESRHVNALYQVTGDELLAGHRFDDAIANGTYRVDIHLQDKPGTILRYLDGHEEHHCQGKCDVRRWRPETAENPTFYQIPLRCLIPKDSTNLIMAGRMLDADREGYGALRVMVNLNQTGEAAGVAAALAVDRGVAIPAIPAADVRAALAAGGSAII